MDPDLKRDRWITFSRSGSLCGGESWGRLSRCLGGTNGTKVSWNLWHPPANGLDVGVFAKKKPLLLASFSSKVIWLVSVFSGSESKKLRWVYTPKVDSSPPEIGWAPKGKDRLPTIRFIKKQFAGSIWTKLCPLVGSFWILKTWMILKTSHLFRPTGLPGYTCLKHNFMYLGSVSTVRIQQFGFKDSACCARCFLGVPWIIEAIWKVDRSCCLCISLHCLL